MGLLDVLNGMQNGPRGRPQPASPGSGGMSKTTMALLALLAYKAFKNFNNSQTAQASVPSRSPSQPSSSETQGGLAGILRTIFGGGSLPGNVLSRGLDNTVKDMEETGHGDIARSWVGRGPNRPITPERLETTLGEDTIRDLMRQTGMKRDDLLETLSDTLPRVIDHLTPQGRLPTQEEASRMA